MLTLGQRSTLARRLLTSLIANVPFHLHTIDAFSFVGAAILLTILGSAAALVPAHKRSEHGSYAVVARAMRTRHLFLLGLF